MYMHTMTSVTSYNHSHSQQANKKTHALETDLLINININPDPNNNIIRGPLNIPISHMGKEHPLCDRETTFNCGHNTTQKQVT